MVVVPGPSQPLEAVSKRITSLVGRGQDSSAVGANIVFV